MVQRGYHNIEVLNCLEMFYFTFLIIDIQGVQFISANNNNERKEKSF